MRVSEFGRFPLLSGLALCLIVLTSCQSDPPTRAQRDGLRQAALALQESMNKRSVGPLNPYLSPGTQFYGMPPELTLAALRGGKFWPAGRVDHVQISSARNAPDGPEAALTLDVGPGLMLLKLGLDRAGRIRFIDDQSPWWETPVSVPNVFTSDIVVAGRLMFVRGNINGKQGFLLLDTGASTLLLNQKYFTPVAGDDGSGISASVMGMKKRLGRAEVASLRWGGLRVGGITGELHDFSAVERPGITPLLGAISYDELKDCALSINWRQRKVQVFALKRDGSKKGSFPEQPADIILPFSYFGFLPMVEARIGDRTYSLLFDSGAELNVLPDANGLGAHFRHPRPLVIRDGGRGKGVMATAGFVDEVRMGDAIVHDMPFVIHDTPYLSRKGFLGVPLLERCRMEINFPARRISLWRQRTS